MSENHSKGNPHISYLRTIVAEHPDIIKSLRAIFGHGGDIFDFAHLQDTNAGVLSLRAAKKDGEQSVIAFLEQLNQK